MMINSINYIKFVSAVIVQLMEIEGKDTLPIAIKNKKM